MAKGDEIIKKLLKENVEFAKIRELHSEYEQKLEEFNKKHYLSDNEKVEENSLKKKKLAAKDKMESIIQRYKSL